MPEPILPTVSGWFADQHILITGATGFMGKILVEKLLRCCPNIAAIYLLIRPKRGQTANQRLDDFINSPVFDILRNLSKSEKAFRKLRIISGDLTQSDLNLSAKDVESLRDNVVTVFNMAANVRFDQTLKTALLLNTGGTKKILDLACTFKRLRAFVHVSTSYCHCDQTELEESTYAAPHDPRKMLDLVTWLDEETLLDVTPKLLRSAPNTYAYTKCLTEQLVTDYADDIPTAITRPSIVTAAWKEPIPGWVDNLNGPTGLLVGAGKGVIRTMHCNSSLEADVVPVDVCMNSIILTAWKLGTSPRSPKPLVVNVTATKGHQLTWGEALEIGRKHFYNNPFSICLWYPGGSIKSSYVIHMIAVFFFHIVPAYVIDGLLTITRGKPFLVRTQKRISSGLEVLQYYTTRPWHFHNERIKTIVESLSDEDRLVFYSDMVGLNWNNYLLSYVLGARKYCIHEEPDTIPHARKVLRRLFYLDLAKNIILIGLLLWFLWAYLMTIFYKIENTFESIFTLIE